MLVEIGTSAGAVVVEDSDVVVGGVDNPSDASVALLKSTESGVGAGVPAVDSVEGCPNSVSSSFNCDVKDAIWFSCAGVLLALKA